MRRLVARVNDSPKRAPREGSDAVALSNAEDASFAEPRRAPVGGGATRTRRGPNETARRGVLRAATAAPPSPSSPWKSAARVSLDENGDLLETETETAWLSSSALSFDEDEDDETRRETGAPSSAAAPLWLEDDLRAVRAAHAAARRAEDAAARLEADVRAARLATAAAVARLLDARVALAAATARAVSEEAATSTALCAAKAASMRLTLDDETGPSGDRGVGTCEALAEALREPLPNVRGLSNRQPA